MSADELLRLTSEATFLLIFARTAIAAARRPRRASVDIALFFGAAAVVVALGRITPLVPPGLDEPVDTVRVAVALALPYFLLRLVDDHAHAPAALLRASELAFALLALGFAVLPSPEPVWFVVLVVPYFLLVNAYATVILWRESRASSGVTRRRLAAVAAASVFLVLAVFFAVLRVVAPQVGELSQLLSRATSLAAGGLYFLGFAPPSLVRRAWQEPELRTFVGSTARLPRLPDVATIVRELEHGAGLALGAHGVVNLWDEEAGVLRFALDGEQRALRPQEMLSGRAFLAQRPVASVDAARDNPGLAELYRRFGIRAVLAAPITAGERRIGVLTVYADRAPFFAEDDLELVRLLADQAAVVLESRTLLQEAAAVRAHEQAARMKEDFLSAAAHDLRTPLTTVIAQAQLLERRARLNPGAPADVQGIQRIVREARRLNALVNELLDASRVEQGRLVGAREAVDLVAVAREVCEQPLPGREHCRVEASESLVGQFDRARVLQLLENLVDNAIKYGPRGGEVVVRVWREDDEARLAVSDRGIGIPLPDLPRIFERFHRASNVDDPRYSGMGLGLYICRGIAEQHGGRIWVVSAPGKGSTFHVALPAGASTRAPVEARARQA